MKSAPEIWAEYRPKIAEAREEDRNAIALAFLPVHIPLGPFTLVPLSVERLLWLEQIKSPFLTGDGPPRREDVLAFLWICSPEFRVGHKYGRRFVWRHCFIRWRKYAALISEYIGQLVGELQGTGGGKGKENANTPMDPKWLPTMVDGFASQYNWTEREIMSLPVSRVALYAQAMTARLTDKPAPTFSGRADEMRHEMLMKCNEANN